MALRRVADAALKLILEMDRAMNRFAAMMGVLAACSGTAVRGDFITIINVPPDVAPASIGSDTQLNVGPEGVLPANFNAGVDGGSTSNIEVNIVGGTIGARFNANAGATVNVTGGAFGLRFRTQAGATANISGGTFGRDVTIERDSLLNIFGGEFPYEVHALFRAAINVWGGEIAYFQAHDEAHASFYGSQFFVDGAELTGLVPGVPTTILARDVPFSGTLADGSTFDFDLISAHPHDQTGPDVDHFAYEAVLTAIYVPTADFDRDFDVDGTDLATWRGTYGAAGGADADHDGDTDGADFLSWQRQVTPTSAADANVVPEPASWWLAAIAAGMWRRRRRPTNQLAASWL
jgi:hypothetical protein